MSRALAAELVKLRTTRTSLAATLGSLALVVIITVAAALAGDFSSVDDPPGADLMYISGLVHVFGLVLGILVVATEFRHGTITPSLLAVPNRPRLVLAKLLAGSAVGALLGLVAALLCAALALPLLAARDIDSGLGGGDVSELIAGNVVATLLFTAIGVGLGALIANQVGAIVGALGWLFVVEPLLGFVSGLDDVIARWFPSGAAAETAGASSLQDPLGQSAAALVLATYAGVIVAAGLLAMRRRDVTA